MLEMEELLRRLLNRLEQVGSVHEELFDTECRQRMANAVMDGFVRERSGFVLPNEFGLHMADADFAVARALAEYIASARAVATELGIRDFHERLSAFQNSDVESEEGNFYDDFFGYSSPQAFDSAGNVIR